MARKVFYSFHYERDAVRAGQVRNCNVIAKEDQVGVIDAADWESIKKSGDEAIKRWIERQLQGTSVTAVLIGAETADREWVLHEIEESWNRGNGVFGIWIHNVKDFDKKTDVQGANPFNKFKLSDGTLLSSICKTYDWVNENGRDNISQWAEKAIKIRANYNESDGVTRVKKAEDILTGAAKVLGAAAVTVLAAKVLAPRTEARLIRPPERPEPTPLRSFTPRPPWCPTNDKGRR